MLIFIPLAQSKERKDEHNNDYQTHEINYSVHFRLLSIVVSINARHQKGSLSSVFWIIAVAAPVLGGLGFSAVTGRFKPSLSPAAFARFRPADAVFSCS